MARALDLGSRGRWFETSHLDHRMIHPKIAGRMCQNVMVNDRNYYYRSFGALYDYASKKFYYTPIKI